MSAAYLSLSSLACSLFLVFLLDIVRPKVRLALAGVDIVPPITIAWIAVSVILSLRVPRRVTNATSRSLLPLVAAGVPVPVQNHRACLEELTVGVAFAHAWLLLNRFVAAINETNIVHLYNSDGQSPWACISLWWMIPAIILFGFILYKCDIGKDSWGFFLVVYELFACGCKIILFLMFTFIALFDASRAGLNHFRGGHSVRFDLARP